MSSMLHQVYRYWLNQVYRYWYQIYKKIHRAYLRFISASRTFFYMLTFLFCTTFLSRFFSYSIVAIYLNKKNRKDKKISVDCSATIIRLRGITLSVKLVFNLMVHSITHRRIVIATIRLDVYLAVDKTEEISFKAHRESYTLLRQSLTVWVFLRSYSFTHPGLVTTL